MHDAYFARCWRTNPECTENRFAKARTAEQRAKIRIHKLGQNLGKESGRNMPEMQVRKLTPAAIQAGMREALEETVLMYVSIEFARPRPGSIPYIARMRWAE
jgi:hypothetical protein